MKNANKCSFVLKYTEMHVTSNRLQIIVDGVDGTKAKVNVPPGELIVLGEENSYFICLSLVSVIRF